MMAWFADFKRRAHINAAPCQRQPENGFIGFFRFQAALELI
ncbi:hypothetical protein [Kingella oralis]